MGQYRVYRTLWDDRNKFLKHSSGSLRKRLLGKIRGLTKPIEFYNWLAGYVKKLAEVRTASRDLFFARCPGAAQRGWTLEMTYEWNYLSSKSPTIFVSDPVLQILLSCPSIVPDDDIVFPMPVYSIATSSSRIRPVLVHCIQKGGTVFTTKGHNLKASEHVVAVVVEGCMRYWTEFPPRLNFLLSGTDAAKDSCSLADQSYRSLDNLAGSSEDRSHCLSSVLLARRLSSYITAFPECLKPGAPDKNEVSQQIEHRESCLRLELPERFRNTPIAHLRAGHFRQLRDERYKRNKDGTYRVVFVSPAIVGSDDLRAYHVDRV